MPATTRSSYGNGTCTVNHGEMGGILLSTDMPSRLRECAARGYYSSVKAYRIFALAVIPLLLLAHISYAQGVSSSAMSAQSKTAQNSATIKKELKLTRPLNRGMTGDDVKRLQETLLDIPALGVEVAVSGYFGSATEWAVKRFQEREGLANSRNMSSGYGVVGPRTLAKINEVLNRPTSPSKKDAVVKTATSTKTSSATSAKIASTSSTGSSTELSRMSSQQTAITSTASSTTSSTATASSAPLPDATPPLRSNGFPSGVITSTTSIAVSLATNEAAHCYWSNVPNTPFAEMSAPFSSTGGIKHSLMLYSVAQGNYSFYVKCRDRALNANTSDFPIIFSLLYRDSGRDRNPPRVFMSFPIDNNKLTEGPIGLLAVAADNSDVAGVDFFLNSEDLNAEDTKPPYAVTIILSPGAYSAFAVARDSDGNHATSTTVKFSVIPKLASSNGTTAALTTRPQRFATFSLSAFSRQSASAASAFRGVSDFFLALLSGAR